MNTTFMLIFTVIFSSFFLSYVWYAIINRQTSPNNTHKIRTNAFLPYLVIATAGFTILHFFLPPQYDQIFDMSLSNIGLIFGGSLLIYLGYSHSQKLGLSFLIFSALLGTLLLPSDLMMFDGLFPLILDRILTFAIWCGFAFCYQYLNGLDGLLATQTAFPLIGIIILSFIGALPVLIGGMSGILLSGTLSFAIYNWYPSQLRLSNTDSQALGFMISSFYIICAEEGCATPILIFSLYYILDISLALFKKLLLKAQYQDIQQNTIACQTNISGLSPSLICENISKLNGLLLIFGCFQAYAPNNYSLLTLGAVLSLWFLHHLLNWQTPKQSLSEINKEVISDIKKNLQSIKSPENKDK